MESNLATKFRRPKNQNIRTVTVWTNSAVYGQIVQLFFVG